MKYSLVIAQWILMIVGWNTLGQPISFVTFGAALAIGLWSLARLVRAWLWPPWEEDDMDHLYEIADAGLLRPHRGAFWAIAHAKGWDKGMFDRWAGKKVWQ